MGSLNIEQFGDLLKTTLDEFNEPNFVDLTQTLTDFPAALELVNKNRLASMGTNCTWRVKVQNAAAAKLIAPTDQDSVNIVDGFVSATVPWRKGETKYAFMEEEEALNNMSGKQLVDLIQAREDGCNQDWINLVEQVFWRFPSAADTRTPFGLPYWCTKNATEGFNGGTPTGYTTVAGLSPSTYSAWNNWTAQYTAVSFNDFVRKVRKMRIKTNFKPPVKRVPDLTTGQNLRQFSNLSVTMKLADLAGQVNDNWGDDLAKFEGMPMIARRPVEYVPQLDEDTTDPMYQVDFGVFKTAVMKDRWMKRKVIAPYPGQRNMAAVFIDTNFAFVCFNRRKLGVIATGTTYP